MKTEQTVRAPSLIPGLSRPQQYKACKSSPDSDLNFTLPISISDRGCLWQKKMAIPTLLGLRDLLQSNRGTRSADSTTLLICGRRSWHPSPDLPARTSAPASRGRVSLLGFKGSI